MRINRLDFLDNISDIQYPHMLVEFFDHFIALKQLVEDYGRVSVHKTDGNSITFSISFDTPQKRDIALRNAQAGTIVIYNKPISVGVEIISETEIKFTLQWDILRLYS